MLPVYANATQGSAQLLPSKSHKNGSVDGKLAIKRYPVYASRGAIAADATIVDGTNLLLLTRGDSGFGICHVDAFATWINFLLQLTSCQHLYVVFDNKRGSRSYPVPDIRRAFAPTYLDNRRNKIQRKHQVPISGRGPIRVDGKDRANRGSKPHSTAGAVSPTPYPLCDIAELRKSSEALMDQPPPHLAGFVHVIRQFGGLALYGLPGHEADDLIASLVAGLLVDQAGGSTHPSAMADGAAATAFTTISTGDAISSTAVATSVACRAHRVVVVSADSDMMQLLTHVGCSWLEVRQLSNSSSPQEDSPLAVRVRPLLGVSEALLRLHDAAGNAQGKSTIKNTNMQDEAEGTVVAAGAVALQARLPPAAYPDFLALVGKAEAGVPGVGVGARAAKKLLVRYRSIDGIVEAYNAGILDGSLRVIRGRSHSSGQADLGPGSSLRSAGDSSGGVGDDGNRACGVNSYPLAVRQVLQNIQVTRMLTDLTSVPWERVLDYQLQRRQKQQQQQQQQEGQEQGEQRQLEQKAHRSLLRQRQWPRPQCTESLQQMVLDAAPPPLHAHDQLHLRSAAPFIDALVAAFRRRGLTCRPVVMDEQGLLSDIVILPDHAECTDALWSGLPAGRAGLAASPAAGVAGAAGTGTLRSTASCALLFSTAAVEMIVDRLAAAMTFGQSAALPACLRTCREATSSNSPSNGNANTSCDSEDLEGDSGSGGCGSRASTGGGFTAVGDQLAAASGGPCASGMLGVEVRVPLCVCVLSPWDFKYEFQGRKLQAAQTSLQQRNADGRHYDLHQKAKQVHQQQNDQHGPPGIETCGHVAGGSPAPSIPAKLAPTTTRLDATDPGIGVTAHPGLLDFACRLRAAIGPRASPTHLSKALQTALRPTTAWRLKRLQRRAAAMSGCVAMVPFFELLEDADRVDSR
ncbi:hypothetical protein Vretifemale_17359 [Volvox reticuliferus]|uniref:5'-3' exonuclease domain-containing protein n=1 Tax=Volvox reticuliferus TaxID=1737510 RepID=A0A8J4CXE3_9CHLO|nr:hypothetical protein Vretifemale_17359 [Volvox reticuliferus]